MLYQRVIVADKLCCGEATFPLNTNFGHCKKAWKVAIRVSIPLLGQSNLCSFMPCNASGATNPTLLSFESSTLKAQPSRQASEGLQ